MRKNSNLLICVTLASLILGACAPFSRVGSGPTAPNISSDKQLNIFIGSEQEPTMLTIVQPWCTQQGWDCQYRKKGSVDQKTILQGGTYADSDGWVGDSFWFASSVWPTIGDTKGVLRDKESMYLSPTVFATWKRIVAANGWAGKASIPVTDIFNAAKINGYKFWWSNPTQSNSGATGYISLNTAVAGNAPGVPLTMAQVNDPAIQAKIQEFVRLIDHTSPSTKDVTDNCVANPDRCDGVFTYESTLIQENIALVAAGKEPLVAVYPDEIALNDSYLTFVPSKPMTDKAVQDKETFFLSLQKYLKTSEAINKLLGLGWRAGDNPMDLKSADASVFNPAWGIETTITQAPIAYPAADVITTLLSLYQTSFRRPVDAIYCLDTSGSMGAGKPDSRWSQVVQTIKVVFDKAEAERYQILTGPQDLTQVLFFTDRPNYRSAVVVGDNYDALGSLYNDVASNTRSGNTNIYSCLEEALLQYAKADSGKPLHPDMPERRRVIFLMTDGQSEGSPAAFLDSVKKAFDGKITVIAIGFSNEADGVQLHSVANPTQGTVIYTDKDAYSTDHQTNKLLAADFSEAMKFALGYK